MTPSSASETSSSSSAALFSRIPSLTNFQLSLLINSNISLSSLLRTPTSHLQEVFDDTLRKMQNDKEMDDMLQDGETSSLLPKHISKSQVRALLKIIAKHLRPALIRNFGTLISDPDYQQREEVSFQMKIPRMDELLGGIRKGILTELVGPAGVGKSQWSISMAVEKLAQMCQQEGTSSNNAMTPLPTILYIDTEDIDIWPRLEQIAQHRFSSNPAFQQRLLQNLNRIHILRFSSSNEMSQFFKDGLEDLLLEKQVSFILLDSIAYLIRKEYSGTDKLWERQNVLLEYATKLKELSSSLRIPVLITNHVVQGESTFFRFDEQSNTRNNNAFQSSNERDQTFKAALGNTWAHCVNTRLVLQEPKPGIKQVIIDKSISSTREVVRYVITNGGVFQDPNQQMVNISVTARGSERGINSMQSRMGIFQGE